MTLADVRDLFAYNKWANDRMIAAVDVLSSEQRTQALGSSFTSILATVAHIAGAEWVWLERWRGASPSAMPEWAATTEWDPIKTRFADLEAERTAFLTTLADADLPRPLTFTLFNGSSDTQPLQVQFQHLVNHGTYHRGQVAGM